MSPQWHKVSGASPAVADCWRLHDNIVGDGHVDGVVDGVATLATYGTCAFGVQLADLGPGKVGNGDIRDLVRDSIAKFSWNELFGAKGVVSCQLATAGGMCRRVGDLPYLGGSCLMPVGGDGRL